MKKAIITGANSFIGSNVIHELISNGVEVVAVVHNNSDNIPKHSLVTMIHCDMENIAELKNKQIYADTFYHFAWNGTVGMTRADTSLQLKNVEWTVDCLRIAKEIGCSRFIGIGSIMEHEVYAAALKQGNRPGLSYIYGAAKQVTHMMCKSVAASIGIDFLWARITNAYGVGEISSRFINSTIRKIINNEPLQFTDGTQNYDFIYITDVATALYLVGEKGKPYCEYLVGSSGAKPLREFIYDIKTILASDREFVLGGIPFSGMSIPLSVFDTSALNNDTGFYCKINFSEGLRMTYEWLTAHVSERVDSNELNSNNYY